MIPYEFNKAITDRRNWYDVPQGDKPTNPTINLHRILHREFDKNDWDADAKNILSRDTKDRLFERFDYNATAGSVLYKRDGWAFDFRPVLNRYVVVIKHYGAEIYYAPDKTSIRNSGYMTGVREIYEIPNEIREDYKRYRENGGVSLARKKAGEKTRLSF